MADNTKAWVCRDDNFGSDYVVFLGSLVPGTKTNGARWMPMSADTLWFSVESDIWEHVSSIRLEPGKGPVLLRAESLEALVVHWRADKDGEGFWWTMCGGRVTGRSSKIDLTDNPADVTCEACLKAKVM